MLDAQGRAQCPCWRPAVPSVDDANEGRARNVDQVGNVAAGGNSRGRSQLIAALFGEFE